jgi:hypothetical protein
MDPEYEQGMVAYGAAYQELSGEVWKKQYLCAEETGRSESDARIRGKG